jgi:hypothetical protein
MLTVDYDKLGLRAGDLVLDLGCGFGRHASEVMEHIPDDLAALDELTRVLRPGGVLAVTIPTWLPEVVCWKLSDEYYAPKSVGGHVRIYTEMEMREKMRGAGLEPGPSHLKHGLHTPYWWLKCVVGPRNDDHLLARAYHRLLVWDISKHPAVTRIADRALSSVMGKSLVVYATKPRIAAATVGGPASAPEPVANPGKEPTHAAA